MTTAPTTDLASWLLARLAGGMGVSDLFPEDKQPAPMTAENRVVALAEAYVRLEALKLGWKHAPESVYQELQAEVLANSRRVLAQVAAMRKVVELHAEKAPGVCSVCSAHDFPCPTLRALAAVWADHEEWREGWG